LVIRAPDGSALESYFWDNVRIKEIKYEVDGESLSSHEEMMAYSFAKKPSGDDSPYVVEVAIKDVGNFQEVCQRTLYVYDDAPPTWLNPPPEHSSNVLGRHGAHTIEFLPGEDCSRTADWLFNWYETEKQTWDAVAVDNCQNVDGMPSTYREVYQLDYHSGAAGALLYSENPANQPDKVVDEYIGEQMLLIKYYAVDAGGVRMDSANIVNVKIHLEDNVAPSADDVHCPAKIHVTLLHNETSASLSWSKPTVTGDNCPPKNGSYPAATEEARESMSDHDFPKTLDQYDGTNTRVIGHSGLFPPGTYEIDYTLRDSQTNVYPHECKVEIEVEQYASPVHLECPDEVPASITGRKNFVPVRWQEPNSNNGKAHQDNNPVSVSYYPPVVPGMAFPWGSTTITVIAEGTGKVADASHNRAECSFVVNVTDGRPPKLNGKKFHCRKLPGGASAPGVPPYRLCQASKSMLIKEHSNYMSNGGYTIQSVEEMPALPCCDAELPDGTIQTHSCHSDSDLISYCKPDEE
jgi:hypothetical protein